MVKKLVPGHLSGMTETAKCWASRKTGTAIATYSYSFSCDIDPRNTLPKRSWGGARNRADRKSHALTDAQVDEINTAANFAISTGWTFQRHWTVLYERAGIAEHDAARFIGKLLDLVSKQARRAGGILTALWVREMGNVKGGHVHILLHLPAGLSLRNRTQRWIETAGGTYCPSVSRVKRVRWTSIKSDNFVSNTRARANAMNVARYLMKSSRIEKGQLMGLEKYGSGGHIVGKRMGSTQNIGKAARKASGKLLSL